MFAEESFGGEGGGVGDVSNFDLRSCVVEVLGSAGGGTEGFDGHRDSRNCCVERGT